MAGGLINRLSRALQTLEQTIDIILGRGFPPGALCAIECNHANQPWSNPTPIRSSIKDILNNGIFWAVPKSRRTIEKRLKRRYGDPKYIWKPPVAKTNILICPKCGHNYQAGLLCGYCYEIVKKETQEMQEAIQENLGLSPVEQNVIVIYEGEKQDKPEEFWKKQRVVELPKKRPEWFHQNLLQPTAEEGSDSKDVKPKDLA